jgi:hypothetical protein
MHPTNHAATPTDSFDRRLLLGAAGLAGLAALASTRAKAGPLDPPAGAVASTAKPLGEIEPRTAINDANTPGDADSLFKITQPGSYYLTGNITGVAGKRGIKITASNVTVDLSGFALLGVTGSLDGIYGANAHTGVNIFNGHVSSWGGMGINLQVGQIAGARIRDITASSNLGAGIAVYITSTVTACIATNNGAAGIASFNSSVFEDCVSTLNGGVGFVAGSACSVINCTARSNSNTGIQLTTQGTASGCLSVQNFGDGIAAAARCLIVNNQCISNTNATSTGAGIHLTGTGAAGNRVEGNYCSDNNRSYVVDSALNILMRNTSFGALGTPWVIAGGNQLQVISPASGAAFSGATGGAAFAPSGYDTNANFTH